MRAAVLHAPGSDLVVTDVTLDDPEDGEVLVRIVATGVCHSDLSVVRGAVEVGLPLVPGHEAAGVVERVGSMVTRVRPGDRVVLSWAPNCGHCFYCAQAHPTLCDVYVAAAGKGRLWDGTSRLRIDHRPLHHYSCVSSFAEFAVVPESGCVALAADVPFEVAALIGCAVTTGFGAVVRDAGLRAGDSIAVIGVGGVGVNAIEAAALSGAAAIVAVDSNVAKKPVAHDYGATHFVNALDEDAVEQVRALTSGRGVTHTVECTGNPTAMSRAYEMTRPGGTVVMVGIARQGAVLSVPATGFPGSKKRIVGSIYGGGAPDVDFARISALYLSGRLQLDRQVGTRFALDGINSALRRLEDGAPGRSIIQFD
ncbi:MAG: alcohol dehydrogenase catalytic domain-containing protein [Gammaproteobacteria bacterium]|nr:alcohol dehydrogenase catalytic domain-containing protein [Gammaproteobacteria bacterium]